MSFLLDTNICSAHLRRPSGLIHRFTQHSGRLYISSIVLGELYVWSYRRGASNKLERAIEDDLLADVQVIEYDSACAKEFGRLRAATLNAGTPTSRIDLMIAAVAVVHDLILVTHNVADFRPVPGLTVVDWLEN